MMKKLLNRLKKKMILEIEMKKHNVIALALIILEKNIYIHFIIKKEKVHDYIDDNKE